MAEKEQAIPPHQLFVELIGELLGRGRRVRFRVHGKSMHPTINDGEMVTVEPVKPSVVKQGDIILYRNPKGLIAHRVVAIAGPGGKGPTFRPPSSGLSADYLFLLRGDASRSCDSPVESSQILGRVVSVERDGRSSELAGRRAKIWHTVRVFAFRLRGAMRGQLSKPLTLKRTILSRLDKVAEKPTGSSQRQQKSPAA